MLGLAIAFLAGLCVGPFFWGLIGKLIGPLDGS